MRPLSAGQEKTGIAVAVGTVWELLVVRDAPPGPGSKLVRGLFVGRGRRVERPPRALVRAARSLDTPAPRALVRLLSSFVGSEIGGKTVVRPPITEVNPAISLERPPTTFGRLGVAVG